LTTYLDDEHFDFIKRHLEVETDEAFIKLAKSTRVPEKARFRSPTAETCFERRTLQMRSINRLIRLLEHFGLIVTKEWFETPLTSSQKLNGQLLSDTALPDMAVGSKVVLLAQQEKMERHLAGAYYLYRKMGDKSGQYASELFLLQKTQNMQVQCYLISHSHKIGRGFAYKCESALHATLCRHHPTRKYLLRQVMINVPPGIANRPFLCGVQNRITGSDYYPMSSNFVLQKQDIADDSLMDLIAQCASFFDQHNENMQRGEEVIYKELFDKNINLPEELSLPKPIPKEELPSQEIAHFLSEPTVSYSPDYLNRELNTL
jgi:hypothetical protein